MKRLLIIAFLIIGWQSFSQSEIQDIRHVKPDYEAIKKEIKLPASKYFYAKLMKKFNQGAYLNLEEKRHLYYGAIFQDNYIKDYSSDLLNDIHTITIKQELSQEDLDKLLDYALQILAENPFDLEAMNYATYVYRQKGISIQNELMGIKFSVVLDAIFSSGDGITEKNALHVIHNRDKAFIPKLMGYKAQSTDFDTDYIILEPNKKGIKGFWYYSYK